MQTILVISSADVFMRSLSSHLKSRARQAAKEPPKKLHCGNQALAQDVIEANEGLSFIVVDASAPARAKEPRMPGVLRAREFAWELAKTSSARIVVVGETRTLVDHMLNKDIRDGYTYSQAGELAKLLVG